MKLVFEFNEVDKLRPAHNEYCLFILKDQPDVVHTATYDSTEDSFYVDEILEYPAHCVNYWSKASF